MNVSDFPASLIVLTVSDPSDEPLGYTTRSFLLADRLDWKLTSFVDGVSFPIFSHEPGVWTHEDLRALLILLDVS